MTDQQSFLAAITAAPDEDTPRLAYADFLQERGDEARAQFIRLQVERFRLPETKPLPVVVAPSLELCLRSTVEFVVYSPAPPPDDLPIGRLYQIRDGAEWVTARFKGEYKKPPHKFSSWLWRGVFVRTQRPEDKALSQRETEILDHAPGGEWGSNVHGYLWSEPLHRLGIQTGSWDYAPNTWQRGFLQTVSMSGQQWVDHADAILAEHSVGVVRLNSWPQPKVNRMRGGHRDNRWREVWLGSRERFDADLLRYGDSDVEGGMAGRLLTHYWPLIKFVPPRN